MAPIQWSEVAAAAAGCALGSLIAIPILRRRRPASRSARERTETLREDLPRYAMLMGFSAFAGCTLVEDLTALLGRERPGGYFLYKYIAALALGLSTYWGLRRAPAKASPRVSEA